MTNKERLKNLKCQLEQMEWIISTHGSTPFRSETRHNLKIAILDLKDEMERPKTTN